MSIFSDREKTAGSGGILSSLLSQPSETRSNNQTNINDKHSNKSQSLEQQKFLLKKYLNQEPCGDRCKRIKQVLREGLKKNIKKLWKIPY